MTDTQPRYKAQASIFPKFYTKNGRLTKYSLACGYCEEFDVAGINLTLWQEGILFHTKAFDYFQRKRLFWDSFETLGEARKRFDLAKRTMRKLI